jgi:hypothetical protein
MSHTLREFLTRTERSLSEAYARVAAQKELLDRLEREGSETAVAGQMLRAFQGHHAMLQEHRDQLLRLL